MKRSEINQYIREAKAFMTKYHFMLPPWADWTPDDWKTKGPDRLRLGRFPENRPDAGNPP